MSSRTSPIGELGALELAKEIHEIALIAFDSSDFEDVVYPIIDRIMETMDALFVGIALIDEESEEIFHGWGSVRGQGPVINEQRLRTGEGIVGHMFTTGRPVCVEDVRQFQGYIELVPGIRSELVVPLVIGERIIGGLDVESDQPGRYGPAETALLIALAGPVAQAIHSARLHQGERRRLGQLTMLNRLGRIVASTGDVGKMLSAVVEEIREGMGCTFVGAGLVDEERGQTTLDAVSTELPIDLPIGHSQPLGEGVVGEAVRSGKSLLVPDVRERQNFVPTGPGLECEMCCPLKVGERVVGYLDAEERAPGAFDDDDLMLLEIVADHIAQAVENARNIERLQRLRQDLTGMVVHDLRNPLMVIQSTLEFIKLHQRRAETSDGAADAHAAGARTYLEQADAACTEMALMVDSILGLNKIDAGAQKLTPQPVAVGELARGIAGRWAIVADAADVSLTCRVAESLPRVELDEELVSRVIKNLVANAIKFTPEGGRVVLEVDMAASELVAERLPGSGDGVVFSVRDDGPGIPEEELERIFEKFATAESRRAGRKYSTGLGLAFCKLAVEAHGGAIWAESRVGEGSSFQVLIPICPPQE